jgi:hypothetical protein
MNTTPHDPATRTSGKEQFEYQNQGKTKSWQHNVNNIDKKIRLNFITCMTVYECSISFTTSTSLSSLTKYSSC